MTFLHASLAAAGLACIAIPIIIHLLMHRRRKPVMWGAMRFLLEAYRRQRRRLMLEKWLLLACRCLVIALLALAIGRPLLGKLIGARSGHTLFVLIDNSLTSGVRGSDGVTALERHKATAKAAIEALRTSRLGGGGTGGTSVVGEGDRVGLIALGSPAEPIVMPPSADLASVLRLIDELEPTDSHADVTGAIGLVAETMGRGGTTPESARISAPDRTYVAILSEFRDGTLDLSATGQASADRASGTNAAATGIRLPDGVTLLATTPATQARTNVTIAGVEPLRSVVVGNNGDGGDEGGAGASGDGSLVRVLLRRSGADLPVAAGTIRTRIVWPDRGARKPDQPADAPAATTGLALTETQTAVKWAQGQESAMVIASLPRAGSTGGAGRLGALTSTAGAIVVSVDDDPLPADNRWRRPVEFRDALRVGLVAPTRFAAGVTADKLDPGTWARLALSPTNQGGIDIVEIEPASIDAARLAGLDAVVLPRPDLIQDSAWARLGLFASSGGVVLVTPPPGLTVHLWSDAMIKGLGLPADWSIPREARRVEGSILMAAPVHASGASGGTDSPTTAATDTGTSRLLELVEGELDELLRPVKMISALPVENTGDSGQAVLKLDSGPVILWAGRPLPAAAGTSSTRGLIVYLGVALSLDWSDLPARPFMVPLMQEIVRQGVGEARGSSWMIAGGRPIWPAGSGLAELRRIDDSAAASRAGAREARPDDALPIAGAAAAAPPMRRAGLFAAADDRGAARGLVAVNPDPRAGRVQSQSSDAVGKVLASSLNSGAPRDGGAARPDAARSIVWLPDSGAITAPDAASPSVARVMSGLLGSSEKGSPIDLPLLIAALVFAIVEVGLARWASHAEVLPASVRQAAGAVTAGVIGGGTGGEAAA